MNTPRPDPTRPGQRSVWDFPRPPALVPEARHLRILHAGLEVASSNRTMAVLETSHPPVYFFPPEDVRTDLLRPRPGTSHCEWKGEAEYLDLVPPDDARRPAVDDAAFRYRRPTPRFREIAGWLSFYAGRLDACFVDDVPVIPQTGDFYSGWITPDVVGPFKGGPGSWGW